MPQSVLGGVKAEIVELAFGDPNALAPPIETSVPQRLTGADNDAAVVTSWLGMFDPEDSARTRVLYRRVSRCFMQWLTSRGLSLRTLTTEHLVSWRDQLKGAPATRGSRLAVVKSLLSHGHRTGYLRFNIGRAVRAPKVDVDVDRRSLTEVQIALMIQAAATVLRAERSRTMPRPRYVRAALTRLFFARFLYYSGARVAEAVAVKWRNLQVRADGDVQLTVLGKGRKRRSFPLPGAFVAQLEAEYKTSDATSDAAVFAFGVRRAQTIIRELAVLSGIEQPVSPHWYRHAAATHALDRGAPIHVVAQTLGHASLTTTSRYAHKQSDGAAKYLPRL